MVFERAKSFFRLFLTVAAASLIFSTLFMTAIFFIGGPLVLLMKTGRLAFPLSFELLSKLAQFILLMSSLMTICVLGLEISKKKGDPES